jgi:phosphopantothenoylcysteine synthetase/decarboxylase
MHAAVHAQVADNDIFIAVAAVADYRPAQVRRAEDQERPARRQPPTIELAAEPGYPR